VVEVEAVSQRPTLSALGWVGVIVAAFAAVLAVFPITTRDVGPLMRLRCGSVVLPAAHARPQYGRWDWAPGRQVDATADQRCTHARHIRTAVVISLGSLGIAGAVAGRLRRPRQHVFDPDRTHRALASQGQQDFAIFMLSLGLIVLGGIVLVGLWAASP
jgi:hypothetical protein